MTTVVATLTLITVLSSNAGATGSSTADQEQTGNSAQTLASKDIDPIRRQVKEGQKVLITDDRGEEWQGRIEAFAPENLVLVTKDQTRRELSYAAILRIDRPRDTLANGALIGLASGAIVGLLAVAAEETSECHPEAFFSCGDPTPAAYALVPAMLGGIGAGIGVGIDALIRREPTLFRRDDSRVTLAPSLGRGVRGLSLSVRW